MHIDTQKRNSRDEVGDITLNIRVGWGGEVASKTESIGEHVLTLWYLESQLTQWKITAVVNVIA